MQVFKAFFKILNKNKLSMVIYVAIFFALSLQFTQSGQENSKTIFSETELYVAVDNKDKGEMGKALKQYLSEKNVIKEVPEEREKLLDDMYYEDIDYVLMIPEDFSEKFMSGERENVLSGTSVPGTNSAYLIENEISEFMKTLGMYVDGGFDENEAALQTLSGMKGESRVAFLSEDDSIEKPSAFYYFQYIPYIFICVMINGLSVVLMAFGNKDVDARNKCSAMSFAKRNAQMVLGSVCMMLMLCALFVGAACVLYPDFMCGVKGILSACNTLIYAFFCVSMAFLVGRVTKNSGQLQIISNVVGLAFSFLGGVFVPMELMSDGIKNISKFVPAYWYVCSNEKIWKLNSFHGAGDIYMNFLVIGTFSIAVLAAAMTINRLKARSV